jgi:O-antigen/teichoic acid export membrane protein
MSVPLAEFAVTVPLAFWLRSYWALVAGLLASKLMGTAISYFAHPFRPRFSIAGAGALFSFSKWLLLRNGLAFLKVRLTDFVIGRSQGAETLGVYSVAYELANLPTSELGAPLNRPCPDSANRADRSNCIRRTSMQASSSFCSAAAAGIFAVSEYLVPVALGPKWLAAVPLIQILALAGAFELYHSSMCTVLIGTGHPAAVVKGNVVFVVLLVILLIPLAERFGASGAAVAVVGASILSTPAYLMAIRVHIGIAPAVFVRAIMRPLTASVAMLAVLRAVMPAYSPSMAASEATWLLLGAIVLGAFLYALVMALLWLAARRPNSVERLVFERARAMLVARTAAWRRKTPDA